MGKRRQNRANATPDPAERAHVPRAGTTSRKNKKRRRRPSNNTARYGGKTQPDRDVPAERLRTVCLVGHRASGKTSLCDLLCKVARVTRDVGSVDQGTSLLDSTPMERRRKQSLHIHSVWAAWSDHVVQLLDAPGAAVLPHERDLALAGTDGALVVVDATQGLEVGTRASLRRVRQLDRSALVVVTKVDREQDLGGLLQQVSAEVGRRAVLVQLPLLDDDDQLVGVIDLVQGQVLRFDPETAEFSPEPIPQPLRAEVDRATEQLAEAVALCDDDLLEHYLEELELPEGELTNGLHAAVGRREIVPVLLTSVAARVGGQALLDGIVKWLPSPVERPPLARDYDGEPITLDVDGPFVAHVLGVSPGADGTPRTLLRLWSGQPPSDGVWTQGTDGHQVRVNKLYRVRGSRRSSAGRLVPGLVVASYDPLGVRPGETLTDGPRWVVDVPAPAPPMMAWLLDADDHDALARALQEVVAADRGLALHSDEDTGGVLLAAASEGHLALAVARLRHHHGLKVRTSLPPVAYREMPCAEVPEVEGLHVREGSDGLVEEYGRCRLALGPAEPDGNRFDDEVDDPEDLPERWRPAIGEGAARAMQHGPTAGYPVLGARVTLKGGAYDCLQSTDDHFRLAGEKGVRSALRRAGTRLLEPWWRVDIQAPAAHLGDLIGDLGAHRGRVVGMEVDGPTARIEAHCPYRELRTFPERLSAITSGQGSFRAEPAHYEPLPAELVGEAIAESPFRDRLPQNHQERPHDALATPVGGSRRDGEC